MTARTPAAVFAKASSRTLAAALRSLEAKGQALTPEERQANAWISDEILRRFPKADAELDRWAEQDFPAESYTATLLRAAGL